MQNNYLHCVVKSGMHWLGIVIIPNTVAVSKLSKPIHPFRGLFLSNVGMNRDENSYSAQFVSNMMNLHLINIHSL